MVGVKSDVGKVRELNEDSFYAGESLFIVADGMGGHNAGEVASSLAVSVISDFDLTEDKPDDYLAEAIRSANERILKDSLENPERAGMGTTVTALWVRKGYVVIGHVGDSRAYLLRDGEIRQLTSDHSLVGELVRSGGITEDEARVHPQRNLITNALGMDSYVHVDVIREQIAGGDVFVLCSDGLTSHLDNSEISRIVSGEKDLQRAAESLVALANERGGSDNITVILYGVQE